MNDEPSWDLFRSFLAVMDEGSLSAAARRLGLTQPTLARHVDQLEEHAGAALFVRTRHGLSPTPTALRLTPLARTMAATAGALTRAAHGRDEEVEGVVRLAASDAIGVERLPPILAALRRTHPRLTIELTLSNAVEDLLRREADIAVRMTAPTQASLVARRLPSIALGLHARRDYLERRGTPTSRADLARHDLIGFDRETPMIRAIQARFPELARSAFALRTDGDLAQLAAIRAGFGVGVCQVPIARRDPNLVRVLADEVEIEMGMWIVTHEDLRRDPRVRAVFDALVLGLSEPDQVESLRPSLDSTD